MNLDIGRIASTLAEAQVMLFQPSPALAGFMESTERRILVRAANRIGKTVHAACKLAKLMLGRANRRYRAVGVTNEQSRQVISKLLAKFIPTSALAPGCHYSEANGWTHNLIQLRNGTWCQIKSSEQDARTHAGEDLDGVWIDEPPPPDVWLESLKRVMSRGGWLWETMTPIGRPCTWQREIVEAPGSPWVQHVVEFNHANCPWYTEAQVKAWIAEAAASPWAYRQTIFGDWEGEVLDRLFTGFDPECICNDDALPTSNERYHVGVGVDHGEGVGKQAAVLGLWTPAPRMIIVAEHVNATRTVPADDARAILGMLDPFGWDLSGVSRIVGDINSAGKLGAGLKVNEVLAGELAKQAGYRVNTVRIDPPEKGKGSVAFGEKLLNQAFMQGRLLIHEDCKALIHALKHYTAGDEDLKHLIDSVRYIAAPVLTAWADENPHVSRLKVR